MRKTVIPVVAACVMFVCGVGCGRLSSHPVVVGAKKEVTRNPRVLELLAGPGGTVECGSAVTGRANETDGIAALQFDASGSKGKGAIAVEGKKTKGEWGVTMLELRPAAGEKISLTADLESRMGTDTPKFDPTAKPAASTSTPPPPTDVEIVLPPGPPGQ
jgi:hypothetical protein